MTISDPSAVSQARSGDVGKDGEIVGLRENGTSLAVLPWRERPGFHERMIGAGQDPDVMRRMIRRGAS
jgi:hypothetical protein